MRALIPWSRCRLFSTAEAGVHLEPASSVPGVTVLTLARTATKNVLSRSMVQALNSCLRRLEDGSVEARALIVRSTLPKVFCAGADLKEREAMSEAEVADFVTHLRSTATRLAVRHQGYKHDEYVVWTEWDRQNLPMPTLAALDGVALGGGLELALGCDVRIAGPQAVLGLPETRLAILPGAGGTQRLPRLIGQARALELVLTGKRLTGQQAYHYGLVNAISSDTETAFDVCLAWSRDIVAGGPVALRMAKQAILSGIQVPLEQGLEVERLCYQQIIPTADRLEGLRAFKEKRSPVYVGK